MLGLVLITFLAWYYHLLGKMFKEYKYSDWFALSIITQVPQIMNYVVFLVLYYTSTNADLPFSLLSYASINQLILNFTPEHNLYT